MILNKFFDRTLVRAAHIWKAATKGVGLPEFGLKESDINNERNGLLLYESIEKAFDHKQLCFIYNPFSGYLHVKILCINLKNMFIIDDSQLRTSNARLWTRLALSRRIDIFILLTNYLFTKF
jgi:hypothetical protein